MQSIQIGNFDYLQDEKGNWFYKAKEPLPLASGEKAKYREQPQFKLQTKIEGETKEKFVKIINISAIEIIKHLKKISNDTTGTSTGD